jgi:hypothetical protein
MPEVKTPEEILKAVKKEADLVLGVWDKAKQKMMAARTLARALRKIQKLIEEGEQDDSN